MYEDVSYKLDPMLTWNAVKIFLLIFGGHLIKIRGCSRNILLSAVKKSSSG